MITKKEYKITNDCLYSIEYYDNGFSTENLMSFKEKIQIIAPKTKLVMNEQTTLELQPVSISIDGTENLVYTNITEPRNVFYYHINNSSLNEFSTEKQMNIAFEVAGEYTIVFMDSKNRMGAITLQVI
ncbi:membrane carboxypeptidase/penicillin-binding protein PbpC [Anaerosolibacter carboniphilus]|uniref:Membrane carboxypeptidase/penicillin-binding protein PbpC n=1 Tax=Anaerosolibacter carboniphilus TaxID=1417629 RepID=A0A841KV28_9FIRM|nr:hypothetical protein [Anaerosolibacter carboniphilus]MBB6217506.1 membrane carboxypeptidase/penicillin-binding protein PbpC [Anaerosolibacter carboniphilus]